MESLFTLAIVWVSVFVASVAAEKTRLTPALYFLAVGAILVNTGVLPEETDPFIRGFAEIGIIVIMFALGFEENSSTFIRSIKRSWGIAFFGALAPFCVAYAVADYFWDNAHISVMFGLTMTATAVSLTMVTLKSEGLQNSKAAIGIKTSAVLDDVASLIFLAILIPFAVGGSTMSIACIVVITFKAAAFFVLIVFLELWVLPHKTPQWLSKISIIGGTGGPLHWRI